LWQLILAAQKGAVLLVDPLQLAAHKAEARRRYEEGLAAFWGLLEQLDSKTGNFKQLAVALLDPVALRAISILHSKVGGGFGHFSFQSCFIPSFVSSLPSQQGFRLPHSEACVRWCV
jgi:hypothetical protein